MSAIPLSEFRAHANLARTVDDAEAQRVLDAAEAWVGDYIGTPLGGGFRTLRARSSGGWALLLPAARLASVVTLTDPRGLDATALLRPECNDLAAGIIGLPYSRSGTWTVGVTFDDPSGEPDVRLAALIVAKHLWETQRGAGMGESARPGFGQVAEAQGPLLGFAIPNRARDLLARHWLPGVA